jgi:archaellum biogenesis protein FlaJ (TadC family)
MKARTRHITLALAGFAAATLLALLIYEYLKSVPSPADPATLDWYVRKANEWGLQARILRNAQVLLAIAAIVSSVLAASEWKPPGVSTGFLAVLAAVSIALLTGLDLTPQANKIRSAQRHMISAILKYRQATSPSLEDLRRGYEEAEALVGNYSPKVGTE